ncbi:YcgL domain-containing protein [Granulosicoccaceae sp. 1_MG-2023]|nr:YcgL domain-containing protein [Granulosicoccaceae sp. 1_MG-2023]
MQSFIYRSRKRKGLYVYLAEQDKFDTLPAAVQEAVGELEFAMELEITPQRKMAKEDPQVVLNNLQENGFHIQMPTDIEELLAGISAGRR